MRKIILYTLLNSFILLLVNLSVSAEDLPAGYQPVTMFKANVVPQACDSEKPPSGHFYCQSELLQKAIKYAFCTNNLSDAMAKMNCRCNFYYAQNNTTIKNGSYDIYTLFSSKELQNAHRIKITMTLATDTYGEFDKKPELFLGLYGNINECELGKKFQSKAFLHHYLMKKYEMPFCYVSKKYSEGVQKIVAEVNLDSLECKNVPLYAVVTYMDGGFTKGMHKNNQTAKVYAYLIEIEKLS